MPKIKTHQATAKRFRRTKGGRGKLVRPKLGQSHLRRKKSRRARAKFDEKIPVENAGTRKRVRQLAPYLYQK